MDGCEKVVTFGDACDAYLDRGNIGYTDGLYLDRLRDELGAEKLVSLTRNLVQQKVTDDRVRRGLKPGTIRRELNTLQAILNYAVECDITESSIRVRKPADSGVRDVWLGKEDMERFLDACSEGFRPFATFLFFTGCRLGEAMAARWTDVVVSPKGLHLLVKSRKGKGSVEKVRAIPLHDRVLVYLTIKKHGLILRRLDGSDWYKRIVYEEWNAARDSLGVAGLTPHCARHSFASQLLMNGVDSRTVAELLGHSSMDMMKRYTHLSIDHLANAVGKL